MFRERLPLLETKLHPPRLSAGLVERSHLLARLADSFEHKLTLLQAPAGFGKTTLANQWLAVCSTASPCPATSWVSLDESENDPFRFWRTVIRACQKLPGPEQRASEQDPLELLTTELPLPFEQSPLEMALTRLLNDLAGAVCRGLLVLDDYHTITEERVHETLTFFLDHLPPALHVLLLSRTEPPLPLWRWRAKGELGELYADDLRFSWEEMTRFFRQTLQISPSDAALQQLDTSLEGWPAGLRILALALRGLRSQEEMEQALTSLGSSSLPPYQRQLLLDYFLNEVFSAQPEALQHFLLHTSVLKRLSGPLCDAVSGRTDSASLLETMMRAGLFLDVLDGESGIWYRFHTLFAETLRREAHRRLGEEALRELSRHASYWYEQHELLEDAIEAALDARDFERAALLIERVDVSGQLSELYIIRRWLSLIPEAVLGAHPLLCWLVALALEVLQERGSPSTTVEERVEVLLHLAEEGWGQQGPPAFLGMLSALRAIRAYRQGAFDLAAEHARQALRDLPEDEHQLGSQLLRGTCCCLVGVNLLSTGQLMEACSSFLQAYKWSLIGNNSHFTRSMLLLVGVCHLCLGELHQAHALFQQILSDARQQQDREILAQALLSLASISYEWNDLFTAEQQAREAEALASPEDTNLRNNIALQLARLAYARGQMISARQQVAALLARLCLTVMPEAAQRLPDVLLLSARLDLAAEDFQAVQRTLTRPDLKEQLPARIFQARLDLAQGRPQEALRQLEQLLPVVQQQQDQRAVLEIQVLLALAYAASRQNHEACQWLSLTLSQARRAGFVRLFLDEGKPLVHLLRTQLASFQNSEVRSSARSILRAFRLTDGGEHAVPTAPSLRRRGEAGNGLLVEPLSSQEQRVLKLLAAGRTNPEIAQELVVSVNTVKDHIKHLYNKLGVNNRLQASEVARFLHLL